MNKKIKKDWVKALKTSEINGKPIVQHTGELRDYNKHVVESGKHKGKKAVGLCCLGVLCELAVAEGIVTRKKDIYLSPDGHREDSVLPEVVRAWAGLEADDPDVEVGHYKTLSGLNDHEGLSFKEIAKVIKEEL